MEKLYKLRFRHLDGDVGPLQFQEATSVQGMKRMIWEEWPTEGEIANKKPETVQHLRLMYQGKILTDGQTITDLKQLPGELVPDRLVTLHLVIAPLGPQIGAARRKSADQSSSSCCVVQ